jgi:hypothetical protein
VHQQKIPASAFSAFSCSYTEIISATIRGAGFDFTTSKTGIS